jgi:hypothetical protein
MSADRARKLTMTVSQDSARQNQAPEAMPGRDQPWKIVNDTFSM